MLPPSEQACSSSDTTTTAAAQQRQLQLPEQEREQQLQLDVRTVLEDVLLDDKEVEAAADHVTQVELVETTDTDGRKVASDSCEPSDCSDAEACELDVVKVGEAGGDASQLDTVQVVDEEQLVEIDGDAAVAPAAASSEIEQHTLTDGGQLETELIEDDDHLEDPRGQVGAATRNDADESPKDDLLLEGDDGIVRATFVDFVEDEHGSARDEEGEDDQGMLMMGNPELQKIREEQVRKWLIFEQENPLSGGVESSLTASMEVDSLAAGGGVTLGSATAALGLSNDEGRKQDSCTDMSNEDDEVDEEEQDGGDGMPRRVRFLTDQEGNLLISVFMSNTPPATTPLSEEPSINGGGVVEERQVNPDDEVDMLVVTTEQQNPSLVVSPPSLDNVEKEEPHRQELQQEEEEELVDSIEPSAPPIDDAEEEDQASEDDDEEEEEDEPPSIVLIAPSHPLKEPPREKPPAPPSSGSGDDCESSDETLSVSSCNSMIEILPSSSALEQKQVAEVEQRNSSSGTLEELLHHHVEKDEAEVEVAGAVTPCFQLGVMAVQTPPAPTVQISGEENNEEQAPSDSLQPASLIIHELEEHNEGLAGGNIEKEGDYSPVIKLPNIDENNNVVEDSILEEEEGEDDDVYEEAIEGEVVCNNNNTSNRTCTTPPQFNPEIGEQVLMPELRRSTSSSSGEVEEDIPVSGKQGIGEEDQQPRAQLKAIMSPCSPREEEDQESQMVSLCIQEEHISAVAVTIAKWESMMSKAQSTENLSNAGVACPQVISASTHHAPVTKSASSPCPKTSSGGLLAPSPQQHTPQQPPKPPMKPIQPVAPVHHQTSQSPVNRLVIHGANSPVSNEPLVVTKAAGWSCWGNKVISNNKDCAAPPHGSSPNRVSSPQQAQQQQENGNNGSGTDEIIYAQPNPQAGSTMTSIHNPSAILKSYPKPLSKGEIVNWLREGEIHRAGLLLNYAQSHHHTPVPGHHANHINPVLVSWFFGLISRQQAERYLHGQPSGTFLVRISTRIWGYTLSYQAANGRTKHFLISAINPAVPATLEIGPPDAALPPVSSKQQRMSPFLPQGRYAFIGTNMTPYGTLVSLIRHHSHAPITKLGGEKLMNPCPGGPQVAGLETLFQKSAAAAAVPTTPSSSNLMMSSA